MAVGARFGTFKPGVIGGEEWLHVIGKRRGVCRTGCICPFKAAFFCA